MEEVQRTYIDSNSNPWGGSAWGALKGQLFSTNAMAAQTAAIISALKPTTTAG